MLVRLTFVKRFTKGGITYMATRVYDVDEKQAAALCNITVNDMPVFKVILPGQVKEGEKIIDFTSEAQAERALEEGDKPDESAEDMEARHKAEAAENKKLLAAKKKTAKKAPAKKAATKLKVAPEKEANVDMVE